MVKKRTARKPVTTSTKGAGKTPAKRSLVKPTKGTGKKPTKRPVAKPTKRPSTKPTRSPAKRASIGASATISKQATVPTKSPAKNSSVEVAATTAKQVTEEAAKPDNPWVVWQDGRGIWVGTRQEFIHSKRLDTIVCDVIDRGTHQDSDALHRAIQLGKTLRQSYANYVKSWLQYNDAEQQHRIDEWHGRLRDMGR